MSQRGGGKKPGISRQHRPREEKEDSGEPTNEAVEAPTKSGVNRPRLPVAMAAAPKPPKVVPGEGTPKEEAALAVTGEIGARVDVGEDSTVQASAFRAEETGEFSDSFGRMGDGELAWHVGDEAWLCDSAASTPMTRSTGHMINYKRVQPETANRRRRNSLDRRIW